MGTKDLQDLMLNLSGNKKVVKLLGKWECITLRSEIARHLHEREHKGGRNNE
ncbi:hypothetical protein PSYJYH_000033 [Bacillus phage PSYJ-YH]|nr:hypothetical protein PSYJYH_000033 [Bacillus phage PSYJ-YH]